MKEDILRLEVKNFRAIENAVISLNGITVLSGVNSSGKSTLSKLLYETILSLNNFEDIVKNQLTSHLHRIFRLLDDLYHELGMKNEIKKSSFFDFDMPYNAIASVFRFAPIERINETSNKLFELIEIMLEKINKIEKDSIVNYKRITRRVQEVLDLNEDDNNINSIFLELSEKIKTGLELLAENLEERPRVLLDKRLKSKISKDLSIENISLFEYNEAIYSIDVTSLPILHFPRKTLYIDTPVSVGSKTFARTSLTFDHWFNLNNILSNDFDDDAIENNELYKLISNDILKGEASSENNNDPFNEGFTFKRKDGKSFDLLDCATGIKSFSILQMLLKKGFISDETLLIIDEPEAHLHPQWIVEYARFLVLLNKELKVKFLISSHSPDLISALKYISAKELDEGKLTFYIARESEKNPYTYNYKNVGTDVSEIFDSFNISMDRISEYGISED